jgi:hypothetical protein
MAAALMRTLCRREVRSCKGNCRCFGEGCTCRDFLMVYQMGGGTNWQQQPNRRGRHSQLDNMMLDACLLASKAASQFQLVVGWYFTVLANAGQ